MFEDIVQRIESGTKVIETDHPNKDKYPNQKIRISGWRKYAAQYIDESMKLL